MKKSITIPSNLSIHPNIGRSSSHCPSGWLEFSSRILLLIDSTTMTVGKTRLPWAPYHGERAAIKLHVTLQDQNMQPLNVTETIGSKHDGPVCESLENTDFIMVMDRAFGKLERLDRYKQDGQSFVIRLHDNVHLKNPHALRRLVAEGSSVIRDITCQLGTPQCRSEKRHRIVIFRDFEGREIRVVTDLLGITAEQIALIYKARWQIEVFFRWIKQHLNIPTLFGTTENAVYGQLFCALIVFVLLKWLLMAQTMRCHVMRRFLLFDLLACCCLMNYR
ncbi:IS4 family transposase [Paenibacillus hemerocallicola]|nr:IS4 family transposase [Paenibacillus hemerocallicola]